MSVVDKKKLEIEYNKYTGEDKSIKYTEILYAEYIHKFSPFVSLRDNIVDLIRNYIVINTNSNRICINGEFKRIAHCIPDNKEYLSEEDIKNIFAIENTELLYKVKREKIDNENYFSVIDVSEKILNKKVEEINLGMFIIGDDSFKATEQDILDIYCYTLYDRPNYECIKNLMFKKENIKLILTEERLKKIKSLKTDEGYKKICESFLAEAENNLSNTCENLKTDYWSLQNTVINMMLQSIKMLQLKYSRRLNRIFAIGRKKKMLSLHILRENMLTLRMRQKDIMFL